MERSRHSMWLVQARFDEWPAFGKFPLSVAAAKSLTGLSVVASRRRVAVRTVTER